MISTLRLHYPKSNIILYNTLRPCPHIPFTLIVSVHIEKLILKRHFSVDFSLTVHTDTHTIYMVFETGIELILRWLALKESSEEKTERLPAFCRLPLLAQFNLSSGR